MTPEEEALLAGGTPNLMMPLGDQQALQLFVIHALRDMSSQQRDTATALSKVSDSVGEMKEQFIRWETNVNDIAALKAQVAELKAERERRAGMQWLVEWVAKYIPWLAAMAAAVWALKVSGGTGVSLPK